MVGTRLAAAFALLLMTAAGAPARAEITQGELDFFLEESYSRYTGDGAGIDMEDVLFAAARVAKSPRRTVSEFAGALNLDERRAERYAALIIASVKHHADCEKERQACELSRNQALVDRIRSTGFEDETGFLLLAAGKNLAAHSNQHASFLTLVRSHPALKVIVLGLFDYTRDFLYIVPLINSKSVNENALSSLLSRTDFHNAAYGLAALDTWRRRLDGPVRSLVSRILMDRLIEFGLTRDAAALLSEIGLSERDGLWPAPGEFERVWASERLTRAYWELAARFPSGEDDAPVKAQRASETPLAAEVQAANADSIIGLAAAMYFAGHERDARNLLELIDADELQFLAVQRFNFLKEMLDPSLDGDGVFDAFVEGREAEEKHPGEIRREESHVSPGMRGWLRSLNAGAPVFQELGAQYLSSRGHSRMARYLLSKGLFYARGHAIEIYETLASELGEQFDQRKEYYSERIESAKAGRKAKSEAPREDVMPTPVHISERPVVFEERPLPDGIRPFAPPGAGEGGKGEKRRRNPLPEGLKLPVSPYQVVRLEKTGKEWTLIFLSQALDPVGEVSRGGYWVTKSRARGHSWEPPVYLGLQQFFPYIVTPESNLPLMNGDVLQIEVQVRELDTESITFPPVALRAKRRQDGLYLRFEWEKLTRDTDSDGLTDLAEHRMGLNPENPDTDGDGLFDGSDSLPLTPFRLREPEENELAIHILKQILGYERQAIITGGVSAPKAESVEDILKSALGPRPAIDPMHTTFMLADPGIFTGIRLPQRLLVYGPGAADRLKEHYGVFYPAGVHWVFSNKSGTKHHVIWSASWTGGEFLLVRKEEGYKVISISQWVT
ncbi:MAG: hypothetical protein ACLFV8_02800 [Alphaproteobacteria bacterium]